MPTGHDPCAAALHSTGALALLRLVLGLEVIMELGWYQQNLVLSKECLCVCVCIYIDLCVRAYVCMYMCVHGCVCAHTRM